MQTDRGSSASAVLHTVSVLLLLFCGSCGGATPLKEPSVVQSSKKSDETRASTPGAGESASRVTARACLWNLKKLGHGSQKNYALISQIIDANCDLIVVVEVMQKQKQHPGFELLESELERLGSWQGTVTPAPRPNTTSGNAEFYATFLREGTLSFCERQPRWTMIKDNDGATGDQGTFVREPAFVCVDFQDGGRKFDFLLGAFHATWSDGRLQDIEAEVAALEPALVQLESEQSGEHDLLLFGDMNLTTHLLEKVTPLFRCPLTSRDLVGRGTTLRHDGLRTDNIYDHLLVLHPELTPEVAAQGAILDVRHYANSHAEFYRTVSDHLPIVVELSLVQADDD